MHKYLLAISMFIGLVGCSGNGITLPRSAVEVWVPTPNLAQNHSDSLMRTINASIECQEANDKDFYGYNVGSNCLMTLDEELVCRCQ